MTRLASSVLLAALGLVAVAPDAFAERRVLVFRLGGSVPNDPGDAMTRLTQVVERAAGLTGAEVIKGQASFEDTAALAGCDTPDAQCLGKVAEALKVDYVVMGTCTPTADGKRATADLKLYKEGAVNSHQVNLEGDLDAMVTEMARDVPPLFVGPSARRKEDKPPPEPTPSPAPVPAPAPAPEHRDEGFAGVSTAWWIVGGVGVVMTGASFVVYGLAKKKQDEVDDAPTDTPSDFEHLRDLEDQGQKLTQIGNGLLIGGGAALVLGGAMILYQGLSGGGGGDDGVSLAPVPLHGGAGLTFRVTMP